MRRKQMPPASAAVKGIGLGALFGIILTLASVALLTTMIASGNIGENAIEFLVMLILGCAAFTTSVLGGKLSGKRHCVACMLSVALYCVVIIGCGVVFDKSLSGAWRHILVCALGALSGCVVCIFTTGKKRSKTKPYL